MERPTRRHFATACAGAGAALLAGCGPRPPPETCLSAQPGTWTWLPEEERRLAGGGAGLAVVVRGGAEGRVLRVRAREAPSELPLERIAMHMERVMEDAGGVGIAGPQVGLALRIAVLKLDYKTDHPESLFVRNPVILERSEEAVEGYEGCLSIPEVGGLVRRSRWILLEYLTLSGERARREAQDHNAVLWQHELDHLDGILYVDRLLGDLLPMEEVRRRRRESEAQSIRGSRRYRHDAIEAAPVLVASAS